MEQSLHKAVLNYVVYDWLHFPPVWLRDQQTNNRTLMRCLEHNQECNYLSIFDPRTIGWYEHFYKHLNEHFSNRVDHVYACILGPYGEGNYPLRVPDWVNMGHCHEGYWCGDAYATRAFQSAMTKKYSRISKHTRAWGRSYRSFSDLRLPKEFADEKFKPSPEAFPSPQDKRRWLDFIPWYHQAIIDFAEQSVRALLKYYPAEKIRLKPGGSAGGVNPIAWGTYCPGYAKMARAYSIVLQPADCQGAVFADKWMGTAYQFYHVKECTEPAGNMKEKDFVRRMFSDASSGAAQFFTYEFEQHATTMQKYIHLLTGKPGETEIAVYCPTTFYRLGGNLQPTIQAASSLRDLCEFDVLDEILIADGALTKKQYKALLLFQADIVDQPILNHFDKFLRSGGTIIQIGDSPMHNVEDKQWPSRAPSPPVEERVRETGPSGFKHVPALDKSQTWLKALSAELAGLKGMDGELDGLWTCRRCRQIVIFNSKDKAVETTIGGQKIKIEPYTIWSN